jgi:hypothetical protein
LAVIGGKQLGVPILVSEIYPNRPAAQCGQIFIGDAILSVNNHDLRNLKHEDLHHSTLLCRIKVELELLFVSPDDELNQIKESVSTTEELNGAKEIETQTEQKTEKHVHFEDSISLTDSTLDPPLDDPSDEMTPNQNEPTSPSENGETPSEVLQNGDNNNPDQESS